MRYPFEAHFLVCTGGRCNDADNGKHRGENIQARLKDLNKSLGRKGTVRVCAVSCLDRCDEGPNMVVWPSGTFYNGLTRKKAVAAYRKEMGDERESERDGVL